MKTTTSLLSAEREQLRAIWNNVYPAQLMHHKSETFDAYINQLEEPEHTLMCANPQPNADSESAIIGWICTFNRNNERWFVLIVDSSCARQGCGTKLLLLALEKYPKLCGWVVEHNDFKKHDGTSYLSPLAFYLKHGFNVTDIRLENEHTSAVKITT
jgi:ribosomal protein S18 acetylase RimI-like enzyme